MRKGQDCSQRNEKILRVGRIWVTSDACGVIYNVRSEDEVGDSTRGFLNPTEVQNVSLILGGSTPDNILSHRIRPSCRPVSTT